MERLTRRRRMVLVLIIFLTVIGYLWPSPLARLAMGVVGASMVVSNRRQAWRLHHEE
jgi:hypothetical protein